jgi:GNAT superfamily N-acetyltransferase
LKIDLISHGDIPHLTHLQPEGWMPIQPYYEFYTQSHFCNPIKCTVDGKIVGIGCSIVHGDTGWLGHIIVDQGFRQQGIGTAITGTLMDFLMKRRRLKSMLLVSTPMGESLYRNLGFQKESEYVFFKGGITPPAAEGHIKDFSPAYRKVGLELDVYASCEDRRKLLEPHWENACFIEAKGELCGFFMPTLGEGFILATTSHSGLELMRKKHCGGRFGVLPAANQIAIEYLQDHGFAEYRRGIRMVKGQRLQWHPKMIYGRIGGNLG